MEFQCPNFAAKFRRAICYLPEKIGKVKFYQLFKFSPRKIAAKRREISFRREISSFSCCDSAKQTVNRFPFFSRCEHFFRYADVTYNDIPNACRVCCHKITFIIYRTACAETSFIKWLMAMNIYLILFQDETITHTDSTNACLFVVTESCTSSIVAPGLALVTTTREGHEENAEQGCLEKCNVRD